MNSPDNRRHMEKEWRALLVVTAIMAALGPFSAAYSYKSIQDQREGRVSDTALSDRLACQRANYQEELDRFQDETLIGLIDAALSGEFNTDAVRAKERLEARNDDAPPVDYSEYDGSPIDCGDLPSQRPFEK